MELDPYSLSFHEPSGILLEDTFRVWLRNQVCEYTVTLTPFSIFLMPSNNTKSTNHGALRSLSCCFGGCPGSLGPLQLFARDLVSCRPATATQANTKFDMGPPLFMLVAYPTWKGQANCRTVLYFHWVDRGKNKRRKSRHWKRNNSNKDNEYFDENGNALVELLQVKEDWVGLIHELFFPMRLRCGPRKHSVISKNTYLSSKVLIVLNPAASSGMTLRVFRDRLVPILRDAGADYEVLVTERADHAYELLRHENLARWKAVLVVSGDGLVGQVFNALFDRPDWQDAFSHLAVAGVPAGKRNAFTTSIMHCQGEKVLREPPVAGINVVTSVLNAARCKIVPMDLMFVQTKSWARVAVLNISWGILNDIRFHASVSETGAAQELRGFDRLRKLLGQNSSSMARLVHVSSMKTHSAVLSYLPAEEEEDVVGDETSQRHKAQHSNSNLSQKKQKKTSSASSSSANSGLKKRHVENNKKNSDSLDSYTCSTCSLTDREHLYSREVGGSSGLTSLLAKTKTPAMEGESSLEVLLPGAVAKSGRPRRSSKDEELTLDVPSLVPSVSTKYTYTSLLTEGQLYFRSWQELDLQLHQIGPISLLNNVPGTGLKSKPVGSATQASKRPKPYFPAMPDMPKALPKEAGWVTEVGDFIAVHILNMPFIDQSKCLVPECRSDDGLLWLLLIRAGVTRRELLAFLRALDSGQSFCPHEFTRSVSGIELRAVRGVRLAPLTTESVLSVDGEPLESCDCLQAFIMPAVARTMIK